MQNRVDWSQKNHTLESITTEVQGWCVIDIVKYNVMVEMQVSGQWLYLMM